MGITLPLLTQGVAARGAVIWHAVLGALYGWNTLGAVVGVVAGEMFLVGRYGVRGTALAAGALNLGAAAIAAALSLRWKDNANPARPTGHPTRTPTRPTRPTRPLVAVFLSGFALLALEVVWFRFLLLFVKGHSNAFPVMLGVVLCRHRTWRPWRIALDAPGSRGTSFPAAPVAFVAAVATVASYAAFPSVIAPFGLVRPSRSPARSSASACR